MKIYIPTRGRENDQVTLRNLPAKLHKDVVLVVEKQELANYAVSSELTGGALLVPQPKGVSGIGPVRDWIVHKLHDVAEHGAELVMMDDDLRFFHRRDEPHADKFESATDRDITAMLKLLAANINDFAHGGVCSREGGNRFTEPNVYFNTRLLRVLAYDATVLRREKIHFNRLPVMEDFDVALQLLRRGYPSVMLPYWCHDQGSSNAAGGCSTYRTMERQAQAAEGLAKLHPGFVRVVTKTTKTAWGGQTRKDVIVSWKKAFESSQS